MQPLTPEILALLPPIYANEGKSPEETKVPLKLFNPCGAGTRFITELDPKTKEAFGYTIISDGELGCIDLNELEECKGPLGLGIEWDPHWDPNTTLAQVIAKGGLL